MVRQRWSWGSGYPPGDGTQRSPANPDREEQVCAAGAASPVPPLPSAAGLFAQVDASSWRIPLEWIEGCLALVPGKRSGRRLHGSKGTARAGAVLFLSVPRGAFPGGSRTVNGGGAHRTLGPRILRTRRAAVVALALIQAAGATWSGRA